MVTLEVTKRSKTDNVAHMRNNGMVPGVVYGAHIENTTVSFEKKAFDKVFKEAGFAVHVTKKQRLFWSYIIIYGIKTDSNVPYI